MSINHFLRCKTVCQASFCQVETVSFVLYCEELIERQHAFQMLRIFGRDLPEYFLESIPHSFALSFYTQPSSICSQHFWASIRQIDLIQYTPADWSINEEVTHTVHLEHINRSNLKTLNLLQPFAACRPFETLRKNVWASWLSDWDDSNDWDELNNWDVL